MLKDIAENARSHGGHSGAWYREILPFRQTVGCGGGKVGPGSKPGCWGNGG